MKATLMGDLHGKFHLISPHLTSSNTNFPIIQLGDFGFQETLRMVKSVHKDRLMIVGGNHDDYTYLPKLPSYLGDYGLVPGTNSTFFTRGAYSIDVNYRTPGVSWWEDEELTYKELNAAIAEYAELKPKVVLTHCAPNSIIVPMFQGKPFKDRTSVALDQFFDYHSPDVWVFGHWHISKTFEMHGTKFICLAEGEMLEMELP